MNENYGIILAMVVFSFMLGLIAGVVIATILQVL